MSATLTPASASCCIFRCPSCDETLAGGADDQPPAVFGCGHVVCGTCASEMMRTSLPICPVCKHSAKESPTPCASFLAAADAIASRVSSLAHERTRDASSPGPEDGAHATKKPRIDSIEALGINADALSTLADAAKSCDAAAESANTALLALAALKQRMIARKDASIASVTASVDALKAELDAALALAVNEVNSTCHSRLKALDVENDRLIVSGDQCRAVSALCRRALSENSQALAENALECVTHTRPLLSSASFPSPPVPTLVEVCADFSRISRAVSNTAFQQRAVSVAGSTWDVSLFKLFAPGSHQAVLTVVDTEGSPINLVTDDVIVSSSPAVAVTSLTCADHKLTVAFDVLSITGDDQREITANVFGVPFKFPIAVTCQAKGEVSRSIMLGSPSGSECGKFDVAKDGSFAVVLSAANGLASRRGDFAFIVPLRCDFVFPGPKALSCFQSRQESHFHATDVIISETNEIFIVVHRPPRRDLPEASFVVKFNPYGTEVRNVSVLHATCLDILGDMLVVGLSRGAPLLLSASTLEQLREVEFPTDGFGGCSSLMVSPDGTQLVMCEANAPYRFLLHRFASPGVPLTVVQDIGTPSQVPWIAFTAVGDLVTRIDLKVQLLDGKNYAVKREWSLPDWVATYADEFGPLDLRVVGRYLYVICDGEDGLLLIEFE